MNYLSFLYIDDNGNGWINGDPSLIFDLPKEWNVDDLQRTLHEACIRYDTDYVSEETVYRAAVEAAKAYHERKEKPKKLYPGREIGGREPDDKEGSKEEKEFKVPARQVLFDLASKQIEKVFRDQTGEVYCIWKAGEKKDILNIDSEDFNALCRKLYADDYDRIQVIKNKLHAVNVRIELLKEKGESYSDLREDAISLAGEFKNEQKTREGNFQRRA